MATVQRKETLIVLSRVPGKIRGRGEELEVAGMSLYNSENNEKKQMASLQWLVLNSGPLHALYLLGSAWRRAS